MSKTESGDADALAVKREEASKARSEAAVNAAHDVSRYRARLFDEVFPKVSELCKLFAGQSTGGIPIRSRRKNALMFLFKHMQRLSAMRPEDVELEEILTFLRYYDNLRPSVLEHNSDELSPNEDS